MNIVEVTDICKTYPAFRLNDVSFSLEEGKITGFIGRNGAGKTTTIKSMLNLIHTDSGEISCFGLPLRGHETEIKQRTGYSTGTVIRMTVLSESPVYRQNALMNANPFFLGAALLIFGMFNYIFIGGFFKTAYNFSKPFLTYIIAAFLTTGVAEALHHFPGLEALNAFGFDHFVLQMSLLLGGALLARVYGVTLDSLMKTETIDGVGMVPPAQMGKNIWGTVTLGDRGQLVIPKAARDRFGMKGGDRLVVASDEHGIALIPAEFFESRMRELMKQLSEKL